VRAVPLIALASVKPSPGVTTIALAVASAWKTASRRLLVEADPSGGDLGLWLGLPAAAGLAGLAAAARRGHDGDLPWRHARELADGTHLVTAPAGAEQAAACVAALTTAGLPEELAAVPEPVLADCGRLYPGSPAIPLAAAAAVTLLVVRPRVSELAHLEPRIHGLEQAGLRLALVLAPDDRRQPSELSYPVDEIAATFRVPVQATLPADPRAVDQLARHAGNSGPARRLPLLREAAAITAALDAALGHPPAGSDPMALPEDSDEAEVSVGDRR
jgi:MinD-like ATPase involved in chromosome partitioning or flagellar assembly